MWEAAKILGCTGQHVGNYEDMPTELERLCAENEALKKATPRGSVSMKVSEIGAVSVRTGSTGFA